MRRLLLGAVALALLGCKTDPSIEAVREADRLYREQQWEAAAQAYASLPEGKYDRQGYGAWRAGVVYRDPLGDRARAKDQFTECARRFEDQGDWGYNCLVELGDLARDAGEPRAAISSYRKAIELRPQGQWSEHCLFESGKAYAEIGEYAQARAEWEELLTRFAGSTRAPEVMLAVARSYDLEGEAKQARRAFQGVHRKYPKHSLAPIAVFGEAEVLEQLGELDAAEELYRKILQTHPNPPVVQSKLEALDERRERRDVDTGAGEVPDSGRR